MFCNIHVGIYNVHNTSLIPSDAYVHCIFLAPFHVEKSGGSLRGFGLGMYLGMYQN